MLAVLISYLRQTSNTGEPFGRNEYIVVRAHVRHCSSNPASVFIRLYFLEDPLLSTDPCVELLKNSAGPRYILQGECDAAKGNVLYSSTRKRRLGDSRRFIT